MKSKLGGGKKKTKERQTKRQSKIKSKSLSKTMRKKSLSLKFNQEQLMKDYVKTHTTNKKQQHTMMLNKQNKSKQIIRKLSEQKKSPMVKFLNKYEYLKQDTFNDTTLNYITGNFGITIPINFLRVLYGDFMSLFRKDDPTIDSTIINTCKENYKYNKICYCCGKVINETDAKSCDHLIPILTMLIIVNLDSIPYNLFFTHRECNSEKGDWNIIDFYNRAGQKQWFKNSDGTQKTIKNCQKRIIEILQNINFNDKSTIHFKLIRLNEVSKNLDSLRENFNLLSNTIQSHTVVTSLLSL